MSEILSAKPIDLDEILTIDGLDDFIEICRNLACYPEELKEIADVAKVKIKEAFDLSKKQPSNTKRRGNYCPRLQSIVMRNEKEFVIVPHNGLVYSYPDNGNRKVDFSPAFNEVSRDVEYKIVDDVMTSSIVWIEYYWRFIRQKRVVGFREHDPSSFLPNELSSKFYSSRKRREMYEDTVAKIRAICSQDIEIDQIYREFYDVVTEIMSVYLLQFDNFSDVIEADLSEAWLSDLLFDSDPSTVQEIANDCMKNLAYRWFADIAILDEARFRRIFEVMCLVSANKNDLIAVAEGMDEEEEDYDDEVFDELKLDYNLMFQNENNRKIWLAFLEHEAVSFLTLALKAKITRIDQLSS